METVHIKYYKKYGLVLSSNKCSGVVYYEGYDLIKGYTDNYKTLLQICALIPEELLPIVRMNNSASIIVSYFQANFPNLDVQTWG